MLELNKNEFDSFKKIHDQYVLNPDDNQEEFNTEGKKILLLIRDWENKLCRQSEKGGYGLFTTSLSDKFWGEVRRDFPEIDNIGLRINRESVKFSIKKIKLD